MVPGQAKKFAQYLTGKDPANPTRTTVECDLDAEYLEHVPGNFDRSKSTVLKLISSSRMKASTLPRKVLLTVDLLPDAPEGGTFRLDRNLRSGFRINAIDYKGTQLDRERNSG